MLVLSRKLGERVLVPHCDLAVTIVSIEGNTVRLGITAPAEIGVYREEALAKSLPGGRVAAAPGPNGMRLRVLSHESPAWHGSDKCRESPWPL